jgi:uncharacterized protein (DUF2384 family)
MDKELEESLELLELFFDHNKAKIYEWLTSPIPLLGDLRPIDMINSGNGKKLLRFIKLAKQENGW